MVLKAASFVPQSAMRILELWHEAGLPRGVINIVTAGRNEAEILLRHPDIVGVSFVGSTKVGRHIYATAAANGKRVQALTEAKNHALVLRDCKLDRAANGIINAFCGCAGERCMALPVICVEEAIADELMAKLKTYAAERKLGAAYDKSTELGPVVNGGHLRFVTDWIEKGIQEGAELTLDGRNPSVPPECKDGFFVGPTILDHVKPGMTCGDQEIFGPVLCVQSLGDDDLGQVARAANSTIYGLSGSVWTRDLGRAMQMVRRIDAGQVSVNMHAAIDPAMPFGGNKQSGWGREFGKEGLEPYLKTKGISMTW